MRVSQNMLYDNFIKYLNNSTTRLQELSLQASTQKKVNRPSDNPVGMARILNYRDSIQANQQYQANIDTATGWLGLADETLMQVQDIMARVNELAVQGANAPLTAENRQSIALEVRQQFDQLISLANTTYEGKSIFAGHRTEEPAYRKGMAVLSNRDYQITDTDGSGETTRYNVNPYVGAVSGSVDSKAVVEFTGSDSGAETASVGTHTIDYRYSLDGENWGTGTLDHTADENVLDLGGVQLTLQDNLEVVTAENHVSHHDSSGDQVTGINANTDGNFDSSLMVRVDGDVNNFDDGTTIPFSYSKDGGQTWEAGNSAKIQGGTAELELGHDRTMTLSPTAPPPLPPPVMSAEETFVVQPRTQLTLSPTAVYQGDDRNASGVEIHETDNTNNNFNFQVKPLSGSFDGNVRVRVTDPAEVYNNSDDGGDTVRYQYSLDGGSTWTAELTSDRNFDSSAFLDLPGGTVELSHVQGADINLRGLEFTIHGTGVQNLISDPDEVHSFAQGDIDQNVLVRIDGGVDGGTGNSTNFVDLGDSSDSPIRYSYSLDGGQTWETGNEAANVDNEHYAALTIPQAGGVLKLAAAGSAGSRTLTSGDQFLIQPRIADIPTEISQDVNIAMNNVGPDIFGGHSQNESGMEMAFEEDERKNLFLGVGKLIAALESNDQEGVQESLGYLDQAMVQVGNMQADIGARENRLQVTQTMLEGMELSDKERKGRIEDVDFAELMSQLSQQQTIYQAILKSSSMIMKMSLVNYL